MQNNSVNKLQKIGLGLVCGFALTLVSINTAQASDNDANTVNTSASVNGNNISTDNKVTLSNNSETNADEETQQAPLVPVEVTKGGVPDVKSTIPDYENYATSMSDDVDKFKVEWEKTPDTSKVGKTTGIVKISGVRDQTTQQNNEESYTTSVTVSVNVYEKDSDYIIDNGNISNEADKNDKVVTNTVKFYDVVNHKIIRTDRFEGYANSGADSDYAYGLSNVLDKFGYKKMDEPPYENGASESAYTNFSDQDQYFTIFVEPKYVDETDDYNTVPKLKEPGDSTSYLAWDKDVDPVWFIGNINFLPQGTKVEWQEKPEFDFSMTNDGTESYYNNPVVLNTPTIKVTVPGHAKPYILYPSEVMSFMLPQGTESENVAVKGNVETIAGHKISAKKVIDFTGNGNQLIPDQFGKINWLVQPDTTKVGYTYGIVSVELPDGQESNQYVLVHVPPKQTETGDPAETPELPAYDLNKIKKHETGEPTTQPTLPTYDLNQVQKHETGNPTVTNEGKAVNLNSVNNPERTRDDNSKLPQTGVKDANITTIMGMVLAALSSMFVFKKRKEN
jgi:LPXTG-motif cell wall-anchored protein